MVAPQVKRKRWWRCLLVLLASPFLLFLLLFFLLYVPPVQRWAVETVVSSVSEAGGPDITLGGISLKFPLDLSLHDVVVRDDAADTLLAVSEAVADVRLRPLFEGRVVVDGLSLSGASFDSHRLVASAHIRASVRHLFLSVDALDWNQEHAHVRELQLEGVDAWVALRDTLLPEDTVPARTGWVITAGDVQLDRVDFGLSIPADTLTLRTGWEQLGLSDVLVNLSTAAYGAGKMSLVSGRFAYDSGTGLPAEGFDFAHLAVSDWDAVIDSLSYQGADMCALLRQMAFRERSGLHVRSLCGAFRSDASSFRLDKFLIKTTSSQLSGDARCHWQFLDGAGMVGLTLHGGVGKQDVLTLLGGELPPYFALQYPDKPIGLQIGLQGDASRLALQTFQAGMDGHVACRLSGTVDNPLDVRTRKGRLKLEATCHDLNFLTALTDTLANPAWQIPAGTILEGTLGIEGETCRGRLVMSEGGGRLHLHASCHLDTEAYRCRLRADSIDLKHFLPADSLGVLLARLEVEGQGLDPYKPQTKFRAQARIDTLGYAGMNLSGMALDASLDGGKASLTARADNALLAMEVQADGHLTPDSVDAVARIDVQKFDWQQSGLSETPLQTALRLDVAGSTDLTHRWQADGRLTGLMLRTPKETYRPKNLDFGLRLRSDAIRARVNSGDLYLFASGRDGVGPVADGLETFGRLLMRQLADRHLDYEALKQVLPELQLALRAGKDNPVSNYLQFVNHIRMDDLRMSLSTSPVRGINGWGYVHQLQTDSLRLDTIGFRFRQDTAGIALHAAVGNVVTNKNKTFSGKIEGGLDRRGGELMFSLEDARGATGLELGVRADLLADRLLLTVIPETPVLAFRPFSLNEANYVAWTDSGRVEADVRLFDTRGTGLELYSTPGTQSLQDLTLNITRLPLAEVLDMFPYTPSLAGQMDASLHYIKEEETTLSASVQLEEFAYEDIPFGNLGADLVYLPMGEGRHLVGAQLLKEEQQILSLDADYRTPTDQLSGSLSLTQFPLDLANGFLPHSLIRLRGKAEGDLRIGGATSALRVDGTLRLDSARLRSPQYSLSFRMDNRPLQVRDSRLQFDDYRIYARGENPFIVNGSIDFADLSVMQTDLRMQASGYELLDAKPRKGSQLYGKVVVDVNSTLSGPLARCRLQGRMNVLGSTDVTYILADSPLTVEDRLDNMVTFMNFNDSVPDVQAEAFSGVGGMELQMTVGIDPGAQVRVDLNSSGDNYVELEGGGTLSMNYSAQSDLTLMGRYTLNSGEMKYSLPVIPLKTFAIGSGSFVEFTGNPMNPLLNLAATERVRTSVVEENSSRYVNFDVGVAITNTLEDMDLQFTLEAPEDMALQNQLSAMSEDERGKLAVTMLVTGMYMGGQGGTNKGFNTNNALNSFLQSEISSIAGSAFKTVDVSFGMEDSSPDDASDNGTDYSFRFAKRFWNNRLSVVIGGTISTGSEAAQKQNESFINDISLEWRLDESGTRNVRLFHNKNYESILEGEITETGIGLVLRRKVNNLGELFIFRRKNRRQQSEPAPGSAIPKESEVTE